MARPEYQPTEEQRTIVAIAAGGGMSHEEIALGLGIDRGTLEKHFARELAEGAYVKRIEALQGLHAAARKGNASAAREYLSRAPRISAPLAPEGDAGGKKAKLGKKEQAAEDAKTAARGTHWDELLPRGPVQ